MKITDVPFSAIDWSSVPSIEHPGQSGCAYWKTVEVGNIRVRLVEYSPGYFADHWCRRGHVVFVIDGDLTSELEGGTSVQLTTGMSYHVADNPEGHRSSSSKGAKLFIVD